jgi:hypothetical protein
LNRNRGVIIALCLSSEPQGKLTIRTEMPIHEALQRRWQFITGKTKTAHDLGRYIFRNISGPPLGRVEGDDGY